MPGPGLITDYLAELSRYLPAGIVDELADGLDQTPLIIVIGLLATAALARHYLPARRAAVAGCLGTAALDTTILTAIAAIGPAPAWPVIVAMTASAARITLTTRVLGPVLRR